MKQNRHIERHQLPYFLKVFNRFTDRPMGYLGNISLDGMLLISQLPLLVGAKFELRLKVPGQDGQLHFIDFDASCQWSREDVTPGYYDSGFSISAPPHEFTELVESLRNYFSFHPMQQSV
ncbi:PilZ domain-containing protein [Pseudomonas asuensis]|jgi:hypothetical protein|uniref:PilZ domain-containing protein n=1 Tax=Pseudomonas asuensis TaxID=1825787 RepID=A0ABQ2GPQ3_9PSED|nr:PilZ domain-containing protein [Pseudomonas asuensis]GGM05129.1 hypothetical protein GCM10009425_15570 [Pseudomonas asuensis]